jgi:ribosome-associated protein
LLNKEKKFKEIPSEEKALLVAEWLYEKQGENIVIMDVTGLSSVTDMTVIVSARGVKHAKALADFIIDKVAEDNVEFLSIEGHKTGEWVLVDLNDVLVHVFLEELREFYNIEGMWSEARRVKFDA